MATVAATDTHYVRCVNPNDAKVPREMLQVPQKKPNTSKRAR